MQSLSKYLTFLPGLWRNRFMGALVTLATGLVGAAIIMWLPDRYEASARTYVDTQSILRPLMQGMAVQPDVSQQLAMVSRALLSRANLEQVAERAGLVDDTFTDARREARLDELGRLIKFESTGRANFFSLTFRHGSPDVALNVVDAVLDIFVNSARLNQERDTGQALAFLDVQIREYEDRLIRAETALKDFKLEHLEVMPKLEQNYVVQTGEVQRAYDTARLELQQLLNARSAIQTQLAGVPESFVSADPRSGVASTSDIERRLRDAQQTLAELRTRYTERHPDVQNMSRIAEELQQARNAELAAIRSGDTTAPGQIVVPNKLFQDLRVSLAATDAQVASLRARVDDARRRLDEVRRLAQTVPEVEAKYKQLNRDYEITKDNYEKLVQRRDSAELSGKLEITSGAADFRVVDPPRVSATPVSPNRPLLLLLLLPASIGAGLVAAFVRSQLRPAFYDVFTLRTTTQVPVFGSVTLVRPPDAPKLGAAMPVAFWLMLGGYVASFFVAIVLLVVGRAGQDAPVLGPSTSAAAQSMPAQHAGQPALISAGRSAARPTAAPEIQ